LNETELRSALAQFHGTESYATLGPLFRHALLTDGVQFLVEKADCLWLVTDSMAWVVTQGSPDLGFIALKLSTRRDGSATLTLTDGNDEVLYRNEYMSTTFPLPEGIELWIEWGCGPRGETWVVMLPSER
jgi:hypothetical protein